VPLVQQAAQEQTLPVHLCQVADLTFVEAPSPDMKESRVHIEFGEAARAGPQAVISTAAGFGAITQWEDDRLTDEKYMPAVLRDKFSGLRGMQVQLPHRSHDSQVTRKTRDELVETAKAGRNESRTTAKALYKRGARLSHLLRGFEQMDDIIAAWRHQLAGAGTRGTHQGRQLAQRLDELDQAREFLLRAVQAGNKDAMAIEQNAARKAWQDVRGAAQAFKRAQELTARSW